MFILLNHILPAREGYDLVRWDMIKLTMAMLGYGLVNFRHHNDHLAVAEPNFPETLKYYCYPIAILSFTTRPGADMYNAYNFIMDI